MRPLSLLGRSPGLNLSNGRNPPTRRHFVRSVSRAEGTAQRRPGISVDVTTAQTGAATPASRRAPTESPARKIGDKPASQQLAQPGVTRLRASVT